MKYGFIGAGNMGGALAGAAAKAVEPSSVLITDLDGEKASALASKIGAVAVTSEELVKNSDVIFFGVKPQAMADMISGIKGFLDVRLNKPLLVSMAAGVKMETITSLVGDYHLIRIMPNLPASVGEGMMLYASYDATEEEIEAFENLMAPSGKLLRMKEELIDAGCALSGCGPAFVYKFIDALSKGGEDAGLSKEDARLLATQTVLGAARHLLNDDRKPQELVDAVCSPGGATIEGVKVLDGSNFENEIVDAVKASFKRTKELG